MFDSDRGSVRIDEYGFEPIPGPDAPLTYKPTSRQVVEVFRGA